MDKRIEHSKKEPLDRNTRKWLEECFIWLLDTFGSEKFHNIKVLTPNPIDFPIKYDGSEKSINDTMVIIATQMDVNPNDIVLDYYTEGQKEIDTGSIVGERMFLQNVENEKYSAGQYLGLMEDNKYHIAFETKNITNPISIVAVLAHEIAHIKLLGEKRINENNEDLTDLITIVFGLGIFNANSSFQTYQNYSSWGWSKTGYLSEMEWGYALALFSFIRGEKEPIWIDFLSTNIKSDFIKSIDYIYLNPIIKLSHPSFKIANLDLASENINYTAVEYKCKNGILIIKQRYHYPNTGEDAIFNGIPAPSGKYKIGWFHSIKIIDGKVST